MKKSDTLVASKYGEKHQMAVNGLVWIAFNRFGYARYFFHIHNLNEHIDQPVRVEKHEVEYGVNLNSWIRNGPNWRFAENANTVYLFRIIVKGNANMDLILNIMI